MSTLPLCVVCPNEINASLFSSSLSSFFIPRNGIQRRLQIITCRLKFPTGFSAANANENPSRSSQEKVYEVVLKQASLMREQKIKIRDVNRALHLKMPVKSTTDGLLNMAYYRCRDVCSRYHNSYLGI